MEPFKFKAENSVPYFVIEEWENAFPHLTVGFSARNKREDMNCRNYAFHVGNRPDQVLSNRKKLASLLEMPFSAWTSGEQVHGIYVQSVSREHRGNGKDTRETAFQETDGMVTDEPDLLLAAYFADCVPLYFYAPDIDWIGIAHAGWKGTVGGIGQNVVARLQEMGANVGEIRAAVGPSIGPCCYEVDKRVMQPLKKILADKKSVDEIAKSYVAGRWQLDLKKANAKILEKTGVKSEHILVSKWCTSCDEAYFYSHRRDEGRTGRMVAWIGKKESIRK